jgi:diguanylate cyclase (GGDEF)-like protein
MHKLLTKIINFRFSSILPNKKYLARDFEIIDQAFNLDADSVALDRQLIKILPTIFNDIAEKIHISINFYEAVKNKNSDWIDQFREFKYCKYLKNHSDQIFKNGIILNTLNSFSDNRNDDNISFISAKIGTRHFYILEIEESRWHHYYSRIFYSALSKFVRSLKEIQERKKLEDQVLSIQLTLDEKEKSLQIAEKAVKRKVYDLHNLVEASNEIYSILNFRQLINSALLTVIGQVGVQSAFMLMYDQKKRSYSQVYQKGFRAKEIQKIKFKVDSPLIKYFTRHNAPVYLKQLNRQKEFVSYVQKLKELGIFIIAPVMYAERVQGIIATGEKLYTSEFTQTDFELFHVLVNIISISIENSLHYEAVKNLSLTDEMTNLHNYRSFISRLKEEINRAKRNKSDISLVILDIDHFKNYNDTLGHQAGDEALREVGKVLRKTVRDEDIVSRYGGEEFCIIFPGIAKEGIQSLGERIRIKIEKHKFYKEKVQPTGQLTISLGGATYPKDANDMHTLIQKADEALYRAKHLGRNQMQIFSKE